MPIADDAPFNHDRTVHARVREGDQIISEVVRYNRSGKFYIEYRDDRARKHVTIAQAVEAAVDHHVYLGRPGGTRFDAKVRDLREARSN